MAEPSPDERLSWTGLPPPAVVRAAAGVFASALAAVLGAFILGEYEFTGLLPIGAGALFGLAVSEVAVEIGRRHTWAVAISCAVLSAAGLLWAGWIAAGSGAYPGGAWLAAGVGALAAVGRVRGIRPRRR